MSAEAGGKRPRQSSVYCRNATASCFRFEAQSARRLARLACVKTGNDDRDDNQQLNERECPGCRGRKWRNPHLGGMRVSSGEHGAPGNRHLCLRRRALFSGGKAGLLALGSAPLRLPSHSVSGTVASVCRGGYPITAAGPRWICTIFPIERRPKWAAFCTVAALIKDCSMEMIPPRPPLCQTKYHQGGAKHLSSLRAPPLPPPGASSTAAFPESAPGSRSPCRARAG